MPRASADQKIQDVKKAILTAAENSLETFFRKVVSQAIEEVIDGGRTGRFSISQLKPTEKAYIGTKVEIVTQSDLDLGRGKKLDFKIAGEDVDIKNTIGNTWMIPSEAFGEICLLIQSNEEKEIYSVGLLRMTPDNLTKKPNKDGKLSVSGQGKKNIDWLVDRAAFPKSFLASLTPEDRNQIFSQPRGQARVTELLRVATGRLIPRLVIETLGQQKDPMRRIRSNGGSPDVLLSEGIVIISGEWIQNREVAKSLGLPVPQSGEVVTFKTDAENALRITEKLR